MDEREFFRGNVLFLLVTVVLCLLLALLEKYCMLQF